MVVISHPTGNANVRQALEALAEAEMLDRFHTTVYWDARWKINSLLPNGFRSELNRRAYPQVEQRRIRSAPLREGARLISTKLGIPIRREFSVLSVADSLDKFTAKTVRSRHPRLVYAYEGVALRTFQEAKRRGALCVYELPSGYWYYEIDLLREEAELRPEYAGTLAKISDSREHLEAKDKELELADHVIVPSSHVKLSLKRSPVRQEQIYLAPYGCGQTLEPVRRADTSSRRKLKVLFAGSLTQRKGIGYLLDAIGMMSSAVELTLLGQKAGHSEAIDAAIKQHRWIPSIPHEAVLAEMSRNDVLVLPSLTEAFGLVITEAMSRGLPVITTPNSGGPEVIRDGHDGFLVPIRSAEAIAEKLELLLRDRDSLEGMSQCALQQARELNWAQYRSRLVATLQRFLGPQN